MVRLVLTDFKTQDENEYFYKEGEFDYYEKYFTYDSFKKNILYLPENTSYINYSLNIISKKSNLDNKFLVYFSDEDFIILFNHKSVYFSKISEKNKIDDIIKSIYILNHMTQVSNSKVEDKIFYIINSKDEYINENLLKHNVKSQENKIICKKLSDMEDIIKLTAPLENRKASLKNNFIFIFSLLGMVLVSSLGANIFIDTFFKTKSLNKYEKELINIKRANKVKNSQVNKLNKEYKNITQCITYKENIKW